MLNFDNYDSVEAYTVELLINQLEQYEGSKIHACDLAINLLETYNMDGCILIYNSDSQEWINHFKDELGQYWDELISNQLIDHSKANFFDSPCALMYCLVEEIARSLCSQIDFINKAWDTRVLLTPQVIKFLSAELQSKV